MTFRAALRPLTALVIAAFVVAMLPAIPAAARPPIRTLAGEVSVAIAAPRVIELPLAASHVALHWFGQPKAIVTIALSNDGITFGGPLAVERDEVGEQRRNGETYSAVIEAGGARFARVTSDRRIGRLSVLALETRGRAGGIGFAGSGVSAAVDQPPVLTRAAWGADESLRFDGSGGQKWVPAFYPVQKLVVHHTAGRNGDPDPAATIRAIYYYHAITQGWGDIGYNFLIDESGRIYEGRYSRPYAAGEYPTGEDADRRGVTAAHVGGYNSGTVGIAFLGTLTTVDAAPAARDALVHMLAWKAERHGIDPRGSALYTNPVNGTQRTFANISGHRDLAATECPGGSFYATLPAVRDAVASRMGTPAPPPPPPATVPAPAVLSGSTRSGRITVTWTAPASGGSAITGYKLYRATGTGAATLLKTLSASVRSYADTSVRSGRSYGYTIRAVNAIGVGGPSNEVRITAR